MRRAETTYRRLAQCRERSAREGIDGCPECLHIRGIQCAGRRSAQCADGGGAKRANLTTRERSHIGGVQRLRIGGEGRQLSGREGAPVARGQCRDLRGRERGYLGAAQADARAGRQIGKCGAKQAHLGGGEGRHRAACQSAKRRTAKAWQAADGIDIGSVQARRVRAQSGQLTGRHHLQVNRWERGNRVRTQAPHQRAQGGDVVGTKTDRVAAQCSRLRRIEQGKRAACHAANGVACQCRQRGGGQCRLLSGIERLDIGAAQSSRIAAKTGDLRGAHRAHGATGKRSHH